MPATVPVPTKSPGDVLTSSLWNTYVAGNINKLLNQAHRRLTVAQFGALASPEDGDEVYLEVDATNGIEWHLVYDAAETTYKWRFVGGPELRSTGSTTLTLPRGGDYNVAITGTMAASTGGVGAPVATVTPSSGAATGRNSITVLIGVPVGGTYTVSADTAARFKAAGVSASATLPWSGNTAQLTNGVIAAEPIRVA